MTQRDDEMRGSLQRSIAAHDEHRRTGQPCSCEDHRWKWALERDDDANELRHEIEVFQESDEVLREKLAQAEARIAELEAFVEEMQDEGAEIRTRPGVALRGDPRQGC